MITPQMDWERESRTGLPEAILAEGKPDEALHAVLRLAMEEGRRALITRLAAPRYEALPKEMRDALDYCPLSRTAILGDAPAPGPARAGIITGGLADLPAAEEARRTLAFSGYGAEIIADCGVAGLWRLTQKLEEIRRFEALIVVAGMEGALFSVLAGLVSAPIIALPVSVGSGVTEGGRAALHSALGSCAPGLVAVNIDNGFGAAQALIRVLKMRE